MGKNREFVWPATMLYNLVILECFWMLLDLQLNGRDKILKLVPSMG